MGDDKVEGILEEYYQHLFTSSNPCGVEEVTQYTHRVVTEEMNKELIGDFTCAEVELALCQMAPLKASGLDGMPPVFYQHYWPSIGDDVTEVVLAYLHANTIHSGLNHTYLTLIPKVKSPVKVLDFRPIALCNILYKIISKVLANRLKIILPNISYEFQSASQTNKAISDNILVAFETLHHLKTKKTGKNGFMAMKLDMSKAYDRVEWRFLMNIKEWMGFHEK